jgi:hypothetical protein
MYRVAWQPELATVLGVTVYSTTIVVASFMAGLAIGSRVESVPIGQSVPCASSPSPR